jgi:hypothetical protein
MRNFKNISGDLLAIAYLPKEDRNSALEDLNIIIGAYPDSDISREQKQLIQEIIEDLIKENTLTEGVTPKPKAKTRATKKSIEQVEVVQPEIVEEEPKTTTVIEEEVVQEQPKAIVEQEVETITSIEDIDDAF